MADKIMVVRHAEKPDVPPPLYGVDADGNQDPESLSVRGWQRAGALACLFSTWGVAARPGLAVPATIYATASVHHDGKSRRPQETVSAVAALQTAGEVDDSFELGQEAALAASAEAAAGPVLIGWHHEAIQALADVILGAGGAAPAWPKERFDMVWVFDRAGPGWRFSQVPQLVLSGDLATPIT